LLTATLPVTQRSDAFAELYGNSDILAIARVYLKLNDRNQARASISTAIRLINTAEEESGWDFLNSGSDKSECRGS
jgi:hypothetical protein